MICNKPSFNLIVTLLADIVDMIERTLDQDLSTALGEISRLKFKDGS